MLGFILTYTHGNGINWTNCNVVVLMHEIQMCDDVKLELV